MLQYIRFTFGTFQQRKLRSVLTMVGIFIGIAMIVTMISLGQGLKSSITQQFESMGTDKIIITPGGAFFGMGQSGIMLTDKDLDTVKKVSGVKLAAGMAYKIARVSFKDQVKYTWVIGLPTDESRRMFEGMQAFKTKYGRSLGENDKYSVIVGIDLHEGKFYDKSVYLKDKIIIEGQEFKVAGVMGRIGNPQDDSQIYIPIDTAGEIFGNEGEYGMIYAAVSDPARVDDIAETVKKNLRKERDVEKGEEDFTVQTMAQLLDAFNTVLNVVQAVLIGLAVISLTVGGVGIMNTMYTSVLERTREIGIMKAIGAKNSDIIILFLLEAGALGLLGGIIGTAFGIILSKTVEFAADKLGYSILKISLSWSLMLFSIMFSFVVGSAAGVFPALRAARLKPVEALRYE